MRVLITGGSGLLGKALIKTAKDNYQIAATWFTNFVNNQQMYQMDVTNKSQVDYIFGRFQPQIVIHTAANGSVDFAEKHYGEVYTVNVAGTRNVIEAAEKYGSRLVYISSNAVFSGDKPPYSEDSGRQPVNRYGSIKRQAEDAVMQSKAKWMILRPFLLYGWPWPGARHNWAKIIVDKLSLGQPLKIVDDTRTQPVYNVNCAEIIWQLLEQDLPDKDIFHIASLEPVSLYGFALAVAKVFELDADLIEPVSSDFFPTIAPRPKDSTFFVGKLAGRGISTDSILMGLERMRDESLV